MRLNKSLQEVEVGGNLKLSIVVTQKFDDLIKIDLNMLGKQRLVHLCLQCVHSLQRNNLSCFGLIQLSEEERQYLLKERILDLLWARG